MSILFFAAALLAQASPAAQPASAPAPAAKKKSHQVCEMLEVTGSRARQQVCRDESGRLDLGPGVSDSAFGKGTLKQMDRQATPAGPH